ncbi:protein of unknown function DUF177 [Paenibacillus curdlanolyticus YK9]|uniref:Metal-binding protein n=1 Tax=Paenibacillus curdlanolyticus YK9 TaxID=717606 RepID=E0I403_9BACL|nr:DUF177 domain-containing protein [Paenibacillus curdlanolyticus]EFM13017.1 protein of unknown function DUF177 [Paenibacillus curdlanolyticus YK9]
MQFRIQEALTKGTLAPIRETLDLSNLLKGRKDVLSAEPVQVELNVSAEEGIIHVDGRLESGLEMACSRCLNAAAVKVDVPFHEQFKQVTVLSPDDEESDEDIIEVVGDTIDLKPYVEDLWLLELPFVPMCTSDCKGLCSECGQNLNERECGCSRGKVDPRLAALKDLFIDDNK